MNRIKIAFVISKDKLFSVITYQSPEFLPTATNKTTLSKKRKGKLQAQNARTGGPFTFQASNTVQIATVSSHDAQRNLLYLKGIDDYTEEAIAIITSQKDMSKEMVNEYIEALLEWAKEWFGFTKKPEKAKITHKLITPKTNEDFAEILGLTKKTNLSKQWIEQRPLELVQLEI